MENQAIKERIDKVISLWQLGHSAAEIADTLGATRNSIMGIVSRQRKKGVKLRGSIKVAEKATVPIPKSIAPFLAKKIAPEKGSKNLPIHKLERYSCRYIVTGDGEPVRYCGDMITTKSYCAAHALRCYISK